MGNFIQKFRKNLQNFEFYGLIYVIFKQSRGWG